MIRGIRCDQKSFRTITFQKGFNVVLAERTKQSSSKDSRNGIGKSTLIEIIHFCLGSQNNADARLKAKELEGWTFTLDITIADKDFSISRNTKYSTHVVIEGDFSDWPIQPEFDSKKSINTLKIKQWNALLGMLMFSLPIADETLEYKPSFRSLISYFIRRDESYSEPFSNNSKQATWDMQLHNCLLLGLNWEYASEFQSLKDKDKVLKDLKSAMDQGMLAGYLGSVGELEAEKITVESQINDLQKQLDSFKVHEQYHKIQQEADELTQKLHQIANNSSTNRSMLDRYHESFFEEKDVSMALVEELYKEAGLIFNEQIKYKLTEVLDFHQKLIVNRKEYLQSEIDRLKRDLENEQSEIARLSGERSTLMEVLSTHGALEEYSKLQKRVSGIQDRLNQINTNIENLRMFEEGVSKLKIATEELLQKARRDKDERKDKLALAITLFNKYSTFLYSEPGVLSIDLTKFGYKFAVEIKRSMSQGIGHMKIFSYDLTLVSLQATKKFNPGFLIHDSTIFDGVDERQIARALELASKESEERGFQYICTINSDIVPNSEFATDFKTKFKSAIVATLTDASESSGLLGIRF